MGDFLLVFQIKTLGVTAVNRWTQLIVAPLAHRTVRCTLDLPVNNSRVTLGKPRERPVRGLPRPGHQTVSGVPLATPMLVFALNFAEFPTYFLCWFMLNFMQLRLMITRQTS
jgi:hypothetical protein